MQEKSFSVQHIELFALTQLFESGIHGDIHWINLYLVDTVISFLPNICTLDMIYNVDKAIQRLKKRGKIFTSLMRKASKSKFCELTQVNFDTRRW